MHALELKHSHSPAKRTYWSKQTFHFSHHISWELSKYKYIKKVHVSNSKLFVNAYYRNKKVLSVGSLSFFHGMQLVLAAYVNCAFVSRSGVSEKTLKGSKQQCQKQTFFPSKGISFYSDWNDKTLCSQIWINQNDSCNLNENAITSISDLKLAPHS